MQDNVSLIKVSCNLFNVLVQYLYVNNYGGHFYEPEHDEHQSGARLCGISA